MWAAAPVVDGFSRGQGFVPYGVARAAVPAGGLFAGVVNGLEGGRVVEGFVDRDGNTRDSAGVKLPLVLDGAALGDVVVGKDGKVVYWKETRALLGKVVKDDALAAAGQGVRGRVWPLGEERGGIGLAYDPSQVAVVARVEAGERRLRDMGVQEPQAGPLGTVVKPAPVSAYVNMYAASAYGEDLGMRDGFQPLSLDFDGAVNVRDWVLEGRVNYLQDERNPLALQDTRLVRDDPKRMVRYQLGQLSYPVTGFQRFRPLLGAGAARNFSLQPYRVTQPLGRSQFVLNAPATVDIYVNGARVKTLQLAAGVYELNDFPVVNGSNTVKLVITDAAGRREEKTFPVVSDSTLLAKGLSAFALSGGVPMTAAARGLDYDSDDATVVGLWRRGLSDVWTAGVNFQGDSDNQLLGGEQAWLTGIGLVGTQLALSAGDAGVGAGGRLEYRRVAPERQGGAAGSADIWQASVEVQSEAFNLDGGEEVNPLRAQVQGSYSHSFSAALGMTAGATYRALRGESDDYRASTGLYYRPLDDVFVNLDGSYSTQDRFALLLNVAWTPGNKADTFSAAYDSSNRVAGVRWARHRQFNQTGVDADVELEGGREAMNLNGSFAYAGERGTVRLEHDQRNLLGSDVRGTRTQLSVASALVAAGGKAAWSAPVANSFAIVTPADVAEGGGVAVNPMQAGDGETYDARSGRFGPAVLRDLVPYTARSIYAEVGQLKGGENTSFVLAPTYKSGLRVLAGTPGRVAVQGHVVDARERPLALQAATLLREDGGGDIAGVEPAAGEGAMARRLVFTNRDGMFRIEGLAPGNYRMVLAGDPRHSLAFEVADTRQREVDLGSYQVDMVPGRMMSAQVR